MSRARRRKWTRSLAEVREQLRENPITTGAGGLPWSTSAISRCEERTWGLLFACVKMCRKAEFHASLALDRANAKFARRFQMEAMQLRCRALADLGLARLDELWEEAKLGEGPGADDPLKARDDS